MTSSWAIERVAGPPGELLAGWVGDEAVSGFRQRVVRICRATSPAVVIGSAQPCHTFDLARASAAGLDVVGRRSGGGAVLVEPEAQVWVDVFVPSTDPLWQKDVGRAFWWLGEAWERALQCLGVSAVPHRGALRSSRWSSLVCFAGLGPGELTVDGTKVVGLAQRRRQAGVYFSCAALMRWRPCLLLSVLALSERERARGQVELAGVAAGLDLDCVALEDAFVASLP